MQKFKTILQSTAILLCMAIAAASCSKSSGTSTTVIGDWKRSSEYEGVARTEAVAFTIADKEYVGGGFDGTNRLNDFWQFDQGTGTWFRKADFPGAARNSAVAFSVNGKAYVGTGYDGISKLNDFWQYDPATNIWTRVADFAGTARYGAVAFSIGNKGYVATGFDGSYLKDLWQYDPATNSWTQMASLGGDKRSDAVAFVYNNMGYIVSGVNNGTYLNDFWAYDPSANTWTEKRKITNSSSDAYDDNYGSNITRSNAAAFIMADKAYVATGTMSGLSSTTWEYDFAGDTWLQKTSFEGAAREGALGFTINNRGYVTTGNNSSSRYDDLWEFLPNAEVNDTNN